MLEVIKDINPQNPILISYIIRAFVAPRVIALKHNKEELRNTNGCYLVTQLFILS